MSKKTYRFIDIYCGAGGFSLGFHQAGYFRSVLAIDNLKPVALTYKTNLPHSTVIIDDVKNLTKDVFFSLIKPDEVDLIIGSPPCEPFTGANPRREKDPIDRLYSDPMGQLTLHFMRIVGYYRPRVFVMENVPAIMEGELKNVIEIEFRRIGYEKIYFNILNAEDYGTPSRRRRVFISNIPIRPVKYNRKICVKEALNGLPPPTANVPNHEPPPEFTRKKLKKAVRLKWGDAMIYYHGDSKLLPNLIKLDPNDIAPTVLGSSRFIHPYENRLLTVREQARLMGFPDTFVFIGGRDLQYNMIGEAVPVPLARAIAEYLLKILDNGV